MRILQILPELHVGGVETGTVDLSRYLVEHGHQSFVVSNGGDLVSDLEKTGGKHFKLPVHKKNLWTAIYSIKKLKEIFVEEKIDLVHVRSRVPGWIAYWACRKTGTPFLTTCHGHYSKHLFSRVMGWSKFVIVPSQVIGQHMIQDFGVSSESIRCIPRSVDLRKFNIPHKSISGGSEYVVSIVGRITPLKGHEYFLKSMARVVRHFPYIKIWIIGDAPAKKQSYKEGLVALTRRLGLSDHVEFLGNRRDIPELLSKTDVLVLSTVTQESFGRVIVEAQAAGVPVVATKVGGVVEIIDHEKTGLLVLPRHPEEMADAVVRLLENKELSAQFVANAKQKILSNYTLEHMASQTLEVYDELLKKINILVIKISAIGDVILATPSLRALREKYPFAKIYCLVGRQAREILQRCPYIDELIVYDTKDKNRGWWGIWKLARKLRKYKLDKTIDFQNNRKSHLLAFLSFCPQRYGYKNKKWGHLLSNGILDDDGPMPAVAHQFRILREIGISPQNQFLELWPSKEDQREVKELLQGQWVNEDAQLVGIHLAASERWATKSWGLEYIAQLCDMLAAQNIRTVITGSEKDIPLMQRLSKITKAKPVDCVGKTSVLQLAALIKRCCVYIAPDSAPLHIAAAVRTPFIALFGPTDPARHMPPAKEFRMLFQRVECAPCYQGQCPIHTHVCMEKITPDQVLEEVEQLMQIRARL
ncbi:MAG: lipopolysaccharide heptosyltransferase II [Candidatus Aceula lacicola]|nr:lipopolysaccharide heptosyltransferase II [Candidatus Aceula lacicola]